MFRIIISLLFFIFATFGNAKGQKNETIDFSFLPYNDFIKKSKETGKPIMIYFTGTGCSLCIKMEKLVFPLEEIRNFYNSSFINIELFDDFKKPDSAIKQLQRKYGIVSQPTFIFIDSTGEVIHKSGYKEKNDFLLVGQQAIGTDNYRGWISLFDKGKVEINGLSPLDAISTWPGAIGYMPQDILISNGTVRENVMLGFDSNPMYDQRVQSAITIAQLSEFVQTLPKGLDQPMGDRGTSISGGQRQRLGIARAVFTAPKLLVLDEATSALDGETEANISSAIQAFRGDVTVLMIAHRLSTVLTADRVVYMDKGEIRAQGSFEEVRRAVPDFDRQANLMGL